LWLIAIIHFCLFFNGLYVQVKCILVSSMYLSLQSYVTKMLRGRLSIGTLPSNMYLLWLKTSNFLSSTALAIYYFWGGKCLVLLLMRDTHTMIGEVSMSASSAQCCAGCFYSIHFLWAKHSLEGFNSILLRYNCTNKNCTYT
jgi:hypothetical protein